MKFKLLILFALVANVGCKKENVQEAVGAKKSGSVQVEEKAALSCYGFDKWEPATVQLRRVGKPILPVKSLKKLARKDNDDKTPTTVIAFITPESQALWVGPQQKIYVELDTGILGGQFNWDLNQLSWRKSMHESLAGPKAKELDAAIMSFESQVDYEKLDVARYSEDVSEEQTTFIEENVSDEWFFCAAKSASNAGKMKLAGYEVEGNEVRVDIENLSRKIKLSAWIDLKTYQILKLTENDKQTFPAEKN